jgi:surfactin synthase thioesterase subunit
VVAYCGSDDQEVSLEQMQQWSEVTSGSFHLIFFSGTHFFPLEKNNEVVAHILSVMKGKGKAPAPAYGPDELNRKL